ncbi:hypothetical protein E0W60_29740 (plasmid) [Cupriavidus oxalaticus]|uniref:Uncharacterized protein n=1 Tax=Cupriavidus oxalaticus TaxID=96344 RepID=A0A4P7LGR1_9BURK|nr:hypothetical protein [Cupriavidus oxalaticus]QBY55280.1 hypothetical protein E0W60_29740 [Cupriavidus oxalaticus]
MKREDLEHIIRAAADITDEYEFVVVGSQSISTSREEAARRQRTGSRSPSDPSALAGWKALPLPPASTAAPKPLESPTPRLPPSVGVVKKI